MTPSPDASSLASCRKYTHTRGAASCTTEIGACGAPSPSIGDVENALAQPDVVSAFGAAKTTVYGRDDREVDGTVLRITRDGKSIDVGRECTPGGSGGVTCYAMPTAVRDLAKLLSSIDSAQLATTACASLK